MNDAQLFVIFLAILAFGWLGFLAGRAWESFSDVVVGELFVAMFMVGSAGLFIATTINLVALVGKNF